MPNAFFLIPSLVTVPFLQPQLVEYGFLISSATLWNKFRNFSSTVIHSQAIKSLVMLLVNLQWILNALETIITDNRNVLCENQGFQKLGKHSWPFTKSQTESSIPYVFYMLSVKHDKESLTELLLIHTCNF